MTEAALAYLRSFAQVMPVEVFVFAGSLIEEIFAPIPSPFVTTLAGTMAQSEGYGTAGLLFIILLATVGKTLGTLLVYYVADKAEDFIMVRVGPKMGLSHRDVERVGQYFTGSSRDYLILSFIRFLPIIPSLPISVAAGVVKLNMRLYLVGTLVGTFFRSALFVVTGYTGLSLLENLLAGVGRAESLFQILTLLVLGGLIGYAYYRRHRQARQRDAA